MKITELIAEHIIEVHEGGNWTDANIKDTLADINYKEASMVTKASYNTIAALVHHLSFYNEIVTQRLSGNNPVISEVNGFNVPEIADETQWAQLKQRNLESFNNLAEAVRAFPEEKIFQLSPTGHTTYYKTLHGISEHAHYHLGQIVLQKKLIRQTKPQHARSSSL